MTAPVLTAEERARARLNLLRVLRELARQRPGPDGDEVRRAIAKLEAFEAPAR